MKKLFLTAVMLILFAFYGEAKLVSGKWIEMDGSKCEQTSRNPYLQLTVELDKDGTNKYAIFIDLKDCGGYMDVQPGGLIKIKTEEGTVYDLKMFEGVSRTSSTEMYPFVGAVTVFDTIVGAYLSDEAVQAFTTERIVKYRIELKEGRALDYTLSKGDAKDVLKELKSEYKDISKEIEKAKSSTLDSDF